MQAEASITIGAPPETVWRLVTDIENSPETISGISKVEILDRPAEGIEGLRWRETRTIGGRPATEIMWITDAVEASYYTTESRNRGAVYRTEVRLAPDGEGTRLTMRFEAIPQAFMAKVITFLFSPFVKKAVKSAFTKDLSDIKSAAESENGGAAAV